MALSLTLTDGTTTLDLNSSPYKLVEGSLNLGRADRERHITFSLHITDSGLAALGSAIDALDDALRMAKQAYHYDLGDRWRLKVSIGSEDIYFRVQEGFAGFPDGSLRLPTLGTTNPYALGIPVEVICDPLGEGDEISDVQNHCADPSFEVAGTPLADWVESAHGDHTITTSRSTAQQKYGLASLLFSLTDSAGSGDSFRYQNTPVGSFAPDDVCSFGVWVNIPAFSALRVRLSIDWYNSVGGALGSAGTADYTTTTSGWVRLEIENVTAPANTSYARIHLVLYTDGAGQTATVYWDGVMAIQAATLPAVFVSCKDISNHFDDNGQAHLNYMDFHGIPGNAPAKLRIKVTEDEAHTKLWAGARIGARQYDGEIAHEGEDFATWTSEPADGDCSGGNYGRFGHTFEWSVRETNNGSTVDSITDSVAIGGVNRLLVVIAYSQLAAGGVAPTSVTYGGVALTKITEQIKNDLAISIWYLVAPATGTDDVVATWAAVQDKVAIESLGYTGVDQGDPLGTAATNSGAGTTATVATAPSIGDIVIVGAVRDVTATGTPSNLTNEHVDFGFVGDFEMLAGDLKADGTSETLGWTFAGAGDWAVAAVPLQPVGPGSPNIFTLTITTPPIGAYRVLARVHDNGASWGVAMGFAYGAATIDPLIESQYQTISGNKWQLVDMGSLIVPPVRLPEGATIGALDLRLAVYCTGSYSVNFDLDYVLLLPVDPFVGYAYVSKDSGTNIVVLDTIDDTPGIFVWDGSDVFQSRPTQEGRPPYGDPSGMRVYFLMDEGTSAAIALGASMSVDIIPRYANLG